MIKNRYGKYFAYNTTSKPKEFKMICSNPRTYSYFIPVYIDDFKSTFVDMIYIEAIYTQTESNEYVESVREHIKKYYKIENFILKNGIFKRDASYFNFISEIIYKGDKDDIIKAKKMFERMKKLEQIL